MNEGDVCSFMYYVERGMVRQFYYKNGRDVTEHFSYEGRIVICIESFLKQEPSRLIVEALETSWVFGIPYEKLMSLIDACRTANVWNFSLATEDQDKGK